MYRTNSFPLPARRRAAVLGAATALAAGAAVLAPAAQATPAGTAHGGTASAAVLRAGLDVSLLGRAVHVPVNASLNDVHAPADARKTALTVTVGGRGVPLLRADAATAKATADAHKAEGYANVVKAQVHLPGLPLLALVKADALTSTATCKAGHRPTAHSELLGVTVLGQRIDLSAVGTTELAVPMVGRVSVTLTQTSTTSSTAAATALRLAVHVNPLALGVAKVEGEVTLAQASCRTPRGSSGSTTGGASGGSTSGSTTGSTTGTTTGSTTGTSGATSGTSGSTSGTSGSTGSTGATGSSGSTATGGSTSGTSGTGGASGGSGSAGTGASGASGTGGTGGSGAVTQTAPGTGNLAETGASSATPFLALGAAGLVAAGAAAYLLTARRRRTAAAPRD